MVLWLVSKDLACRGELQTAVGAIRTAVHDRKLDALNVYRQSGQLRDVALARPHPDVADAAWPVVRVHATDPQRDELQPVLVHVESSQRLSVDFGATVERIRPGRHIGIRLHAVPLPRACRMVGAGEADPLHPVLPAGLQHVVSRNHVRLQQFAERTLARYRPQVRHRVHPLRRPLHRLHIFASTHDHVVVALRHFGRVVHEQPQVVVVPPVPPARTPDQARGPRQQHTLPRHSALRSDCRPSP